VVPFISCDREVYRLGEFVQVIYGADRPGWVHVFSVEPSGKRALLRHQEVSGNKIYSLTAMANRPAGRHAVIAVFSKGAEVKTKSLPLIQEGGITEKGLTVVPEDQAPYAVYRFRILEQ
jgi:hypothetical protein